MDTVLRNRIAHTTRQMLASTDWDWRHGTYDDPIEQRAAEILRDQAARARAWLLRVSALTPLALPRGTDGAWNLVPCVTESGCLGIVDIALGRAVEYDCPVPSYVRRFAVAMSRAAVSAHDAGGSGGIPSAWSQIALLLTDSGVRIQTPDIVRPVHIITGLSTCYGTIGEPVVADESRTEWAAIAETPQAETTDPQWEQVKFGQGVDATRWDQFIRTIDRRPYGAHPLSRVTISHHRGNCGDLHYVYVTGHRAERTAAIEYLRQAWGHYVRREAIDAVAAIYRRSGLALPASRAGVRHGTEWPGDPCGYGSAALVADLCADPMNALSAEDQRIVRAVADAIRATAPDALRGTRGHISARAVDAVIDTRAMGIYGREDLWRHVAEQPGVAERFGS